MSEYRLVHWEDDSPLRPSHCIGYGSEDRRRDYFKILLLSNQNPMILPSQPNCTDSGIVPTSNIRPLIDGEGRTLPTAEDLDAHCEQMGIGEWPFSYEQPLVVSLNLPPRYRQAGLDHEDSDAIRSQGGCA